MAQEIFMLKLLLIAMLLFAAPAYTQELVPQSPASAKSQDKTSALESKVFATSQNCEETGCDARLNAQRPNTPLGARISDVLTRQDREAAVDILDHERVTLNDRMNLLVLAGRNNEAADIAFILMERSSLDESLYAQAAPILFAGSRASGVMTMLRDFDSYESVTTEVSTTGHAFGRLKLDFNFHQEMRNNPDTTQIATLTNERGGELVLHQRGDSYLNSITLQSSQAFDTQNGMSIRHQRQVGSRLKLDTMLSYNQMATENASLRIIGRNNQIAFESSYSLDNNSQWIVGGGHNQYNSIDGQALGRGNLLTSTLGHELTGVHPAMRTRLTGTWNRFQAEDSNLLGRAEALIPAGEVSRTAAYFMPEDVSEIAAYINIGDATDSKFPARSLEYVGEIGVFNNPASGTGWRASAGLAGRVIGADRLNMFIRFDQSPGGQDFSSLEVGVAYLLVY